MCSKTFRDGRVGSEGAATSGQADLAHAERSPYGRCDRHGGQDRAGGRFPTLADRVLRLGAAIVMIRERLIGGSAIIGEGFELGADDPQGRSAKAEGFGSIKANKRGTASHRKYMKLAFNQAIDYARALPEKPSFVITCDAGGDFNIWQGFSESWVGTFADYGDYESRRRVPIADLTKPEIIAFLIDIFEHPQNRNPERIAALVTQEAAEPLAVLARQLEAQHGQESAGAIVEFLMRCIFTMFAEDVALLRREIFTEFFTKCLDDPRRFKPGVESFWRLMDKDKWGDRAIFESVVVDT